MIRQLIARGALRTDSGEFASLVMVQDKARPILRAEETVMLRDEPERAPRPARRARERPAESAAGTDDPLFESLRQWRTAEAKVQGVPPYVIFHDSVLREIAGTRPGSLARLGELRGVGASKLERYGDAVLGILQA